MSEIIASNVVNNTEKVSALEHQSPFKKWAGLGVLTLGLAIVIIDTTLLNVSLSAIIKDLNTDLKSLQWVITAYALTLAALTITGGRLGDLFGRRNMFMLGAIIFAVGSLLASVSHSITVLLLGEAIIEGVGAALMMPATSSLVVANFSGKERATAFGIWGGVAGASSAIGPLLGGYLTSHFSWRWGFRINVFVAAVVILGSLFLLAESKDDRKPTLDWWGVLLSSLGLLALTFGIVESSSLGWWQAKSLLTVFGTTLSLGSLSLVPVSILLGFIILAVFAWWEIRVEKSGKSPLVSMNIFKNRQFTSGVATISILSLGMTGMIFALPVFLQSVKKLNAFDTGLALLPLSAAILIVAPVVGILSKKIDPRYFIWAGLSIDVVAAFILKATISSNVPISHLVPGLALYGVGMAMVFAPISNIILSAVPVQMSGEASGVNNTMRQVGATLGAAIIGAAVLTSLSTHLTKGIEASPNIPQVVKAQIIQTVSNPDSNVEFGASFDPSGILSPFVGQEIQALVNESSTRATKDAYAYSALFAFICLVVALFLPKMHTASEGDFKASEQAALPKSKFMLAGVAVILALVGTGWLLRNSAKATVSTGLVNVEEIRNLFAEPNALPIPTPEIKGEQTTSLATSTEVSSLTPRGPGFAVPDISDAVLAYKNKQLGFEIEMPAQWQVNEIADSGQVLFVNQTGIVYSVQSLQNSKESLDSILTQLKGSPSAWNIERITFSGQPALRFQTSGIYKWGTALIHGNRIFYIFGPNLDQGPLSKFSFL